ncbi:hypothetical protein OIDMADRAFT_162368 [Oidiodendron maius Zn]|uniref:Uncharacterized protein n=1 Tax=Oidiodendron maius (strain Zn) TaxID=913774 RepID=A0A0C3H298_OIDMZ|nr:hypothetical protein OIDMADRAFT_162368 [Oidiodendron maius Zn]
MSITLPSLAILPPPPSPATHTSLSAAYRPTISSIVSALKGLEASTELLIVLPCPSLHGRLHLPRCEIYAEVQKLLGGLYSLICIVCAKLGADVDLDTPGAIDSRIILLDYDPSQTSMTDVESTLDPFVSGPVIDLPTFSLTRRRWNLIFSVDGEEGQRLLSAYMNLANRISPPVEGRLRTVSGGVSLVHKGLQPSHQPQTLIVGLTGDELLKNKKYAEFVGSWDQRQQDVVNFFVSILSFTRAGKEEALKTLRYNEPGPNGKAVHTTLKNGLITIECVEIQDPYGPTITDESITAIVVSGETRAGGQAVNERRVEKGWHALEVFEVDVLDAAEHEGGSGKNDDFASKISSSAIRKRKAEIARTSSL